MNVGVKGYYRAGGHYNMALIYKFCERIENKNDSMKVNWMRNAAEAAKRKLPYIPKSTLQRWLEPDVKAMARKGKQGVDGISHWRAERDCRRRKELPKLLTEALWT